MLSVNIIVINNVTVQCKHVTVHYTVFSTLFSVQCSFFVSCNCTVYINKTVVDMICELSNHGYWGEQGPNSSENFYKMRRSFASPHSLLTLGPIVVEVCTSNISCIASYHGNSLIPPYKCCWKNPVLPKLNNIDALRERCWRKFEYKKEQDFLF